MNKHGLTKENLVVTLPPALRTDPSVVALAEALSELLAARPAEIERLRIYPAIDTLEEPLLDILARDFKVDWWDPEYSLEEKRRTLKDSWRVHRLLGTRAAVETAISAIYPHTQVLEWFEYGGEPYHFRLDINITNDSIDSEKQRRVLERMNFYKSLRSHNDGVTYFVEAEPAVVKAVASAPGLTETLHVPLVLPVPLLQPTASIRVGATTGLWESVAVRVELPTPVVRPTASVRVGAVTGLWESMAARAELPTPIIRPAATARTGAAAALYEAFTAGVDLSTPVIRRTASARLGATVSLLEEFEARLVLPDGAPAQSAARLRAVVASTWQECYVTQAVPLMDKVLTATAQAHAKGVVASTQETAKTHINLQEVDYGGTE